LKCLAFLFKVAYASLYRDFHSIAIGEGDVTTKNLFFAAASLLMTARLCPAQAPPTSPGPAIAPAPAAPEIPVTPQVAPQPLTPAQARGLPTEGENKTVQQPLPLPIPQAHGERTLAAQPLQLRPVCDEVEMEAHKRGYNVLQYNAQTGDTAWFALHRPQYRQNKENPFLPEAYSNDQIMVEVCGLKFDTQVTVGLSTIGVPERGPGFRGTTPTVAQAAAANTSDALQAVSTASNSAFAAMIPPNSTVASLAANAVVAPGLFSGANYTDTSIKATAEDFIRTTAVYAAEADSTATAIGTIQQSANNILAAAQHLAADMSAPAADPASWSNTGVFDNAKAEALQFATKLGAFDSQISAAGLGARLAGLATTYNALAGNLSTVQKILATDLPSGSMPSCAPIPASNTNPNYLLQEACYVKTFLDQINAQLTINANGRDIDGVKTPQTQVTKPGVLYGQLGSLRNTLLQINDSTSQAFASLNTWYENSNVVYSDNLTPSASNVNIRVGINATQQYVPFTLNYSSTALTVPPAPPTGHFESITEVVVQERVHFNLEGGFLAIHVPTKSVSYSASSVTTPAAGMSFMPCGTGSATVPTTGMPPTYYCPTTSQSSGWQVAGMVGLTWIPWGRNYYPKPGHYLKPRTYGEMFGLMIGTAVTNLGSGFGGINIAPVNGISIYAGIASAHSSAPSLGIGSGLNVYTNSSPPNITTLRFGTALGIGFDLGVFSQIFKSGGGASGPGLP